MTRIITLLLFVASGGVLVKPRTVFQRTCDIFARFSIPRFQARSIAQTPIRSAVRQPEPPTIYPHSTYRYLFSEGAIQRLRDGKPILVDLAENLDGVKDRKIRSALVEHTVKGYSHRLSVMENGVEIAYLKYTTYIDQTTKERFAQIDHIDVNKDYRQNGINSALFGLMDSLEGDRVVYISTNLQDVNFAEFEKSLNALGYTWVTMDPTALYEALQNTPGVKIRRAYGWEVDPTTISHFPNASISFRSYRVADSPTVGDSQGKR